MISEGKFGPQEAICLITISILSKIFFTSPRQVAEIVGTAGWYMTLISAFIAAIGFTFVFFLLKKYKNKNIIEIYEIVYGKYIGIIISGLTGIFFLVNASVNVREFGDVLKVYMLPITPLEYILIIFAGVILTLCIIGLESIARLSKLSSYFIFAGIIIVLLLSVQNYDINHLFPLLGYGLGNTVLHGAARSSVYGDVFILAVIANSLQGINHIKKSGYFSIIISGILASVNLLAFILAFPYSTAQEITSPMYELSALIDYGRFIQRIDPIFFFVWIVSSFILITIYIYSFISIYCKMFKYPDLKPVLFPAIIMFLVIALIPEDVSTVVTGYIQSIREYGWIIFYFIPFITFITSLIFKKEADA
ncbi:MAG TPA: endospore germination permease [Clostridiales bacterium]|nr:endospore germination permease [Clostridiales bacterium]